MNGQGDVQAQAATEETCLALVLSQSGSVLMSEVHAITKGHVDVPGLGYHQSPCGYSSTVLSLLPHPPH